MLTGGVVDGCGGRKAKVVGGLLWWFGCWRALFENGGEAMFAGWGCGGEGAKVVAVWCSCLGALLVVAIWLLGRDWSKIMIEKRKNG